LLNQDRTARHCPGFHVLIPGYFFTGRTPVVPGEAASQRRPAARLEPCRDGLT